MTRITVTAADFSHIDRMRGRFRQADVEELREVYHFSPEEACERGIELASHAWTVLADGEPVCMTGILPMSALTGVGVLWIVGTEWIDSHGFAFARASRQHVDRMLEDYEVVLSRVSVKRDRVLEWAKWLGFAVCDYTPETAYIELRRVH